MKLKGFNYNESKIIFDGINFNLSSKYIKEIIDVYRGNPFALNIISNSFNNTFGIEKKFSDFDMFQTETVLEDWVKSQYESISIVEKQILFFIMLENGIAQQNILLSLNREIQDALSHQNIKVSSALDYSTIIQGVDSLRRRSLVEFDCSTTAIKLNLYMLYYLLRYYSKSLVEDVYSDTIKIIDTEFRTVNPNDKVKTIPTYKDIQLRLNKIVLSNENLSEKVKIFFALKISLKAGK
ncbi:MAG: hypothetical protein AAGE84_31015 [Cyanobacteria bacterium P01_G01_bin.39]